MLNIVIPLAGRGSRFVEAGYEMPKPLIPIDGEPMIKHVIDNLTPRCRHRFIFICQQEHIQKYGLDNKLKSYTANSEVIGINHITEGQICTVLLAKHLFNNDEELMTANSDQWVDFDINLYLETIKEEKLDGMIMTLTMQLNDPKWSYVRLDENGYVIETAEKKVISNTATVGIFNFTKGTYLVEAAEQMIKDNLRVNNEFYTCPCYNYLIKEGMKIGVYNVGEQRAGMYGLGTPEDLEWFLSNKVYAFTNRNR